MSKLYSLLFLYGLAVLSVNSAVVNQTKPDGLLKIECEFEQPNGLPPITHSSLGFMVETDGYLLTTYKAISDPDTNRLSGKIKATIEVDGTSITLPARVIGVEATLNFSILKVDYENPLPILPLNKDRELVAEEPVHAYYVNNVGEYDRIAGSFTEMNVLECYQANLTATMLKTEITLPDDSVGAPILDGEGKVFAMHTAHVPELEEEELEFHDSDEPEIFLLSMKLAMTIYDSVKQRRSMKSPWTGFSVRRLSDEENKQFPMVKGRVMCGIGLEHIWERGPAEALGIQRDDILIKFGHYPVCSVAEFQKWLYLYGVDQPVKLYLVRDDKMLTLDYIIEERPAWAKPW